MTNHISIDFFQNSLGFSLKAPVPSFARDLINEPLSTLTAEKLAEEIKNAGKKAGFSVDVFNKKKIESLKMGGVLAVNKGSIDPPTFSVLTWKPDKIKNKKT